jgi:predicted 3-demethylubiquinone-9 3-methyltransferase (glyoxalase superfamily)
MPTTQKITTCLWYDADGEHAAKFYVSLFDNSRIFNVLRYGDAGPGPKGSAMVTVFELDGRRFSALNGGPTYKLSPAASLLVECETQEEVDRLWNAFLDGGQPQQCGWITDRFGLSWQIVPKALLEMMQDSDPARVGRVMGVMMQMVKLEIAPLQKAYDGE